MRYFTFILLPIAFIFPSFSASTISAVDLLLFQQSISVPPTFKLRQSHSPKATIHWVDFANFTYSIPDSHKRSFRLRKGEQPEVRNHKGIIIKEGYHLGNIKYGDVTGDGQEEAFVSVGISTGGSSIPDYVYIYSLQNRRPKLLWSFATGDRADGGLRQIFAEHGELVIELYGKGKIIGSDLFAEDGMLGGDCCPTHFTRARYRWNGKRFVLKGKPEVLPNPAS
ncbi:MAG TPA: hypothetical protein VEF04_07115 [Blastocatellia bacterium]|nr:hypothetical protein [Blastocatellia bacterium]